MARLRWIYFLYYAGVGTFLSYFPSYLRGLGFRGEQIGLFITAQQIVAAPAVLAWAHLADRLGAPARALRFCAGGAALAALGLLFARSSAQVGISLVALGSCSSAVIPLVDSLTVEVVRRGSGHTYARTRLWGSIGFVAAAQGVGLLLSMRGERPGDPGLPAAYLLCAVGYAIAAQGAPELPAHPDRPHWREALQLLRQPPLLFVLAICTLHWLALAPYHLLFGILVRDRGLPSAVTGLATSLGVLGEVGALMIFPVLERRVPLRGLFAASFLATAARWALTGTARSAPALVALQLLHAFSFGLFWACAVEAMARAVPHRLRATGQALLSAIALAGGNAVGYALAGRGYDRFGDASPLFFAAAAIEVLPLVLLLMPLTPARGRE